MKFHRELSAALTFACVGVGLASPALADPPAPGGWALTHQNVPDAVVCNDGHRGVGNITYRWGRTEGTISGTANSWVRDVPTCSDTTKTPTFSFTLTKVS